MIVPNFDGTNTFEEPFPYFCTPALLASSDGERVLSWLSSDAPWTLRTTDFYEQHEFSLLNAKLDDTLTPLIEPCFTAPVMAEMRRRFRIQGKLSITEVAAHRLVQGQTIRVHNDYLGGEETHRLLVQLNSGWAPEQGGLLMFFGSRFAQDVRRVLSPLHRSAVAFEISPSSFHAVSQIKTGERFTLVYTFKAEAA